MGRGQRRTGGPGGGRGRRESSAGPCRGGRPVSRAIVQPAPGCGASVRRGISSPLSRAGGFSLPELLIVLIIISILSALLVPNLEIVKYRMDGAVRGIASAMVAAQRQAVSRQHDVVVAFDKTNRRLRIHEDADNNGQIDAGERTRYVYLDNGVVFGLGGAPPLFTADIIGFTETQSGMPALRFIRNGSVSEEGHVYLTSARAVAASRYPQDSRAVKVDRATGRVTWYYYDPDEWKKGF